MQYHYNFLRPHRALRFGSETRTPAMQAGLVSTRLAWSDVFSVDGSTIVVVAVVVDVSVTRWRPESEVAALPTRCSPSARKKAA